MNAQQHTTKRHHMTHSSRAPCPQPCLYTPAKHFATHTLLSVYPCPKGTPPSWAFRLVRFVLGRPTTTRGRFRGRNHTAVCSSPATGQKKEKKNTLPTSRTRESFKEQARRGTPLSPAPRPYEPASVARPPTAARLQPPTKPCPNLWWDWIYGISVCIVGFLI